MKNISLKTIILSILSLFAIHCNAEQYELVTSTEQLVDGGKYIIVYTSSGNNTNVMEKQITSNKCGMRYVNTLVDNTITLTSDDENVAAIITLQKNNDTWALYEESENKYYAHVSSQNQIKKQEGAAYYSISFTGNNVNITSNNYKLKCTESGFCFTTSTSSSYYTPQLYKQKSATPPAQTYQRDVTPNKLSTICLENGVDDTSISGAKFYSIIGVKGTEGNRTIYFGEVTGALTAGQPYLFIPSRTTLSLTKNATPAPSAGSHNGLIGTFTEISDDAILKGKYIANNNTIRKCGTGCTVGANRAYIDMTQVADLDAVPSNEAEAKGILEFGIQEDDVTGIISLGNLIDKTPNTKVFNTSGQQISNNTHGIVIINGKKHVR